MARLIFFVSFLIVVPLHAYEDEWRNARIPQPQPWKERAVVKFTGEAFKGGVEGDFISKPTIPNIIGNIIANITPLAPIADFRDSIANAVKMVRADFKENKLDFAMSAAGFVPAVTEVKGLAKIYKVAKEKPLVSEAIVLSRNLPSLPSFALESFEKTPTMKLFKKGDTLYRAPQMGESAFAPGRFMGTSAVKTSIALDNKYNINAYGNPAELLRKYEFTKDTYLPWGKVRNGNGHQVYIPENIYPEEVLKWVGHRKLN